VLVWPVYSELCAGESDGDEYDQSEQGPDGRHGRQPADARGPGPQGRTAQGFPREDPCLGPVQAAVDQPCSGAPVHPGENLIGHEHVCICMSRSHRLID